MPDALDIYKWNKRRRRFRKAERAAWRERCEGSTPPVDAPSACLLLGLPIGRRQKDASSTKGMRNQSTGSQIGSVFFMQSMVYSKPSHNRCRVLRFRSASAFWHCSAESKT